MRASKTFSVRQSESSLEGKIYGKVLSLLRGREEERDDDDDEMTEIDVTCKTFPSTSRHGSGDGRAQKNDKFLAKQLCVRVSVEGARNDSEWHGEFTARRAVVEFIYLSLSLPLAYDFYLCLIYRRCLSCNSVEDSRRRHSPALQSSAFSRGTALSTVDSNRLMHYR